MRPYRAADDLGEVTGRVRSTRAVERLPLSFLISGERGDDLVFREAGVEIVRRERIDRIRFDEVRELRTLERSPSVERYRILTQRNELHEIRIVMPDTVSAFAQLHEPTIPHLLAAAPPSVRTDHAELPWDAIDEVRIEGARLVVIGRDHRRMELALADVANPHVLVARAAQKPLGAVKTAHPHRGTHRR